MGLIQAGAFTKQLWGLEEQARHKGGLPDSLVAFRLDQGGPWAGGKDQLVQPAGGKGLDLPSHVSGQLPFSPEVNVCIILKYLDLPYKTHSSSADFILRPGSQVPLPSTPLLHQVSALIVQSLA